MQCNRQATLGRERLQIASFECVTAAKEWRRIVEAISRLSIDEMVDGLPWGCQECRDQERIWEALTQQNSIEWRGQDVDATVDFLI
jgi:hypothetical protein